MFSIHALLGLGEHGTLTYRWVDLGGSTAESGTTKLLLHQSHDLRSRPEGLYTYCGLAHQITRSILVVFR